MNQLSPERRARVIQALFEGNSVRATCRLTGTAKGTVLRLLAEIGNACRKLHDEKVRGIQAKRVQCDEIWSYVGVKEGNLREELQGTPGVGDTWTWVALDQDSKLAIAWAVGDRGPETARPFVKDLASRLANRVQLTTDGHPVYLKAVADAFHYDVDYAMLLKHYENDRTGEGRYSPPRCTGTSKHWISGNPVKADVSTSHVERSNLTMRMQMRRFTRLTNAFSKKFANHVHAVALHFAAYNFCKPHRTLTEQTGGIHTTPAMAAGLTNRVWKVADLVALLDRKSN